MEGRCRTLKNQSVFVSEAQVRLSIQQSTSSEIKCGYECWVQQDIKYVKLKHS